MIGKLQGKLLGKPKVIIESPYMGCVDENIKYARECVRDSLLRGEVPIASHLLYTQEGILRDWIEIERQWGISLGLEWYSVADVCAVYLDRGLTAGMSRGIAQAKQLGVRVDSRYLRALSKHSPEPVVAPVPINGHKWNGWD